MGRDLIADDTAEWIVVPRTVPTELPGSKSAWTIVDECDIAEEEEEEGGRMPGGLVHSISDEASEGGRENGYVDWCPLSLARNSGGLLLALMRPRRGGLW